MTERVKELLRNDETFLANPKSLRADPHPGKNNTLVILCEVQGKRAMFSAGEDEDVSRELLIDKSLPVTVKTDDKADAELPSAHIDDNQSQFVADEKAFPKIEMPMDDQGRPFMQTIRLNDKVVEADGRRYSGFRFVVDRAAVAQKQGVADKESMGLFWFFVTPASIRHWYIIPVKGTMRGFDGFFPLKMSSFKGTASYLPSGENELIVQNLVAGRLKEGQEYIIWFACPKELKDPMEATVALGYKVDNRNFHRWQDLTGLTEFLGLTPAHPKIDFKDEFKSAAPATQ